LITIQESEDSDDKWNDRLIKSGLGTIYQTKENAYLSNNKKDKPFILFLNENGEIIGQLLLNKYPRFENRVDLKSKILRNFPFIKKSMYNWTYGPIIFDINNSSKIYFELNKFLKNKKSLVSGWQHPFCTEGILKMGENFHVKKWSTFIIDLNKTKEEIYNGISKHSGRKNIERSIERGVVTEEITEKNLHEYAELYHSTRENILEKQKDIESIFKWWKKWKPLGYGGYIAKKDNVLLSGMLFSSFNNHIIEGSVARSDIDRKKKLYSQDLIKWKIIEWGIKNEMNYYNLAGFNPNPISKKEEGIIQYKQKWGGDRYDFWWVLSSGNKIQRNFG
jgi:hypothetical protein